MPKRGDQRMIIFGDMGNVAIDYSMHHSWDFGNDGEIYSINTSHTINLFTNGSKDVTDAVIHIGDISYAVGYLSEWDDFFHEIEPVSSHIPWMTGIYINNIIHIFYFLQIPSCKNTKNQNK